MYAFNEANIARKAAGSSDGGRFDHKSGGDVPAPDFAAAALHVSSHEHAAMASHYRAATTQLENIPIIIGNGSTPNAEVPRWMVYDETGARRPAQQTDALLNAVGKQWLLQRGYQAQQQPSATPRFDVAPPLAAELDPNLNAHPQAPFVSVRGYQPGTRLYEHERQQAGEEMLKTVRALQAHDQEAAAFRAQDAAYAATEANAHWEMGRDVAALHARAAVVASTGRVTDEQMRNLMDLHAAAAGRAGVAARAAYQRSLAGQKMAAEMAKWTGDARVITPERLERYREHVTSRGLYLTR